MGSSGSKVGAQGGHGSGWAPGVPGQERRFSASGHDVTPLTTEERIAAAQPLSDFQRYVTLQVGKPGVVREIPMWLLMVACKRASEAAPAGSLQPCCACCACCRPARSAPLPARRSTAARTTTSARASTSAPWAACRCSARVRAAGPGLSPAAAAVAFQELRCSASCAASCNAHRTSSAESSYPPSTPHPLLAEHKYDSGTGWPSFYKPLDPEHVIEVTDNSIPFMVGLQRGSA